jgi:hypothetical protein
MTSEIVPFHTSRPAQKITECAYLTALILAMLAMVPAQVFRLYQHDSFPWLMADYAGRLFVLTLLFLLPAGRMVLLKEEKLQAPLVAALFWIVGIVAFFTLTDFFSWMSYWLPMGRLGDYPRPEGFLYLFDLTFGLALVAFHEEIVSRRLAAIALKPFCRSERMLIIVSAALFAVFHWWTGLGNMISCFIFGVVAMACYRRLGALWPIGIAHYALDAILFA